MPLNTFSPKLQSFFFFSENKDLFETEPKKPKSVLIGFYVRTWLVYANLGKYRFLVAGFY